MKQWIHQRGHKGQEIVRLQKALGGLDPDGAFGPKTEAALKQFQSQNNIEVTGKSSDIERGLNSPSIIALNAFFSPLFSIRS